MKYRVVIIEPSEIIREGIRLFLEKSHGLQVVESFPDIQSFERKVFREEVHAILFNPSTGAFCRLPDPRSLFAAHPGACVVALLYQYVDAETLRNFDGTVDIYGDGWKLSGKIMKIIESAHNDGDRTTDNVELSVREKDILIALAQGLTNKEIADKLNISAHTVISHRKNIVRKTGIKTVSGLTLYALFNNLISQDEL